MTDTISGPTASSHPRLKARARWLIVLAALLWSTSGLFAKSPIFSDWREAKLVGALTIAGPLIAFWRTAAASAVLLPAVRKPRFRPAMLAMGLAFGLMSVSYMSAMALTTAANAIWLQSSAPLWVFLYGRLKGTEPLDRLNLIALASGLAGIGCILWFEIQNEAGSPLGVLAGLASGITYAWVVISLRHLRQENPAFLVCFNHAAASLLVFPLLLYINVWPTWTQLAVLFAFGTVQMGLPYLLFASSLRHVSGEEASLIALLEPVAVPVWVWLAWGEETRWWTVMGGAMILAGLAVRYAWPWFGQRLKRRQSSAKT